LPSYGTFWQVFAIFLREFWCVLALGTNFFEVHYKSLLHFSRGGGSLSMDSLLLSKRQDWKAKEYHNDSYPEKLIANIKGWMKGFLLRSQKPRAR